MIDYKIIRNSAKCLNCDTEVESTHRHDFKSCKCGNISVDGGKDYIRRVLKNIESCCCYQDTSITEPLIDKDTPAVV